MDASAEVQASIVQDLNDDSDDDDLYLNPNRRPVEADLQEDSDSGSDSD
jgi:hypothetical protein